MAVLPAVTTKQLNYSVIDTWTDCSAVSTVQKKNGGSGCSYYSTVTSQCYEYTD
jgi:hypothetical protein